MGITKAPKPAETLTGPVSEILNTPGKFQDFIDALVGDLEYFCTTQHGVGLERAPLDRDEFERDVTRHVVRAIGGSEKELVEALRLGLVRSYGITKSDISSKVHSLLLEQLDVGPIEKMPVVGDEGEFADALSYELASRRNDPMEVRAAIVQALEGSSDVSVKDFAEAVSDALPANTGITSNVIASKVRKLLPGLAYGDSVGLLSDEL